MDRMPKAAASASAESSLKGGRVAAPNTSVLARHTSTGKLARVRPRAVSFSFDVRAPWRKKEDLYIYSICILYILYVYLYIPKHINNLRLIYDWNNTTLGLKDKAVE